MTDDPRRFLQPPKAAGADAEAVRISGSPGIAGWLLQQKVSFAYTSYRSGRLILVGVAPDGRLSFNEQDYVRAMGLAWHDGALHVASLFQIWRLENMLRPGEYANAAHDAVLVPRTAHTTGYVDAHELAVDGQGRILFVNSRWSCLAALDERYSFTPIWKPPFISALAPEDRCHLNGLAMADGQPRYVTAVGAADTAGGWRERRSAGGLLIDVASGGIVTDRLSMPHSPRVHDGAVWVLDSGRGRIVRIEPGTGEATDILFCPGFLRGMAIWGDHAVVAVSKPRESSEGLPFGAELARRGLEPWCGILIVSLSRGAVVEHIRYESGIDELFDVCLLPGLRNPVTIGPATEEILSTVRPRPDIA
jgi:uncharacterized protein (TIGR03032 family)